MEYKDCIACAEQIRSNAILCRHCKTRQDDLSFKASEESSKSVSQKPMSSSVECPRCSEMAFQWGKCDRCGYKAHNLTQTTKRSNELGWGLLFDAREENRPSRNKFRFNLILSIALTVVVVVGTAVIYPESWSNFVSTVFQTQNPYFKRGYEAAELYAEKGQTFGYAYAYCTVLGANVPGLPDAEAVNQFIKGCQTYILEP